ncbi:MAG: hypothetical protein NC189_07450 [Bacteroides sp.]|nr:hypothetical protein [Bacteroides sp.]
MEQRLNNGKGIFLLWLNWLLGSGMITLLALLSIWVRPLYMPFVAYGFQLFAFTLIRHNRTKRLPVCYVFPFVVSRVMFWSGTVMLIINLLFSRWLVDKVFDPTTINPEIPFICTLIVWPITALTCAWAYTHRQSLSFCRDCRMRSGTAAERGFLGMIFTREGYYQIRMGLLISLGVSIVAWSYYALTYVNSHLSVPDKFVFFWSEAMLWLAAAIYLGARYLGIWGYYCQDVEGSVARHGRSTQMRYILVADNLICLRPPQTAADVLIPGVNNYDTPASVFHSYHNTVSMTQAERFFTNLTSLSNVKLRFFYANISGNADCNIFHYFGFLTPEQKARYSELHPEYEWVTFRDVVKMLNSQELNPLMSAELIRLYKITMAWKTYTKNGMRRYKIKHYRPTFRLEDLVNWTVDYNDAAWLYVADNNQDVPFYHLRRLWRKYVNGVGNYIEEITPPQDDDKEE